MVDVAIISVVGVFVRAWAVLVDRTRSGPAESSASRDQAVQSASPIRVDRECLSLWCETGFDQEIARREAGVLQWSDQAALARQLGRGVLVACDRTHRRRLRNPKS